MRTLVHLSDLHFGAIDEGLLDPLRQRVAALRPDLVVVSGDLTQRAKAAQFLAARRYLDSLPRPQVVVPGNHDVPLYDLARRFLSPLGKYRRYLAPEAETAFLDDELAVVGVSTARSLVIKAGRINAEQVERVRAVFGSAPAGATRVVVTHHPLELPAAWDEQHQVAGRAPMALESLAQCGADVYLSGHLHRPHSGDVASFARAHRGSPLVVSAGTATSTRGRGETNSFNVLHVDAAQIAIEHFCWDDAARDFSARTARVFRRLLGGGWAAMP